MRIIIKKISKFIFLFCLCSKNLCAQDGQIKINITKTTRQQTQTIQVPVVQNGKVQNVKVAKMFVTYSVLGTVNESSQAGYNVRFAPQDFSSPLNRPNFDCLMKIAYAGSKTVPSVTLTIKTQTVDNRTLWDINPSNLLGTSCGL